MDSLGAGNIFYYEAAEEIFRDFSDFRNYFVSNLTSYVDIDIRTQPV